MKQHHIISIFLLLMCSARVSGDMPFSMDDICYVGYEEVRSGDLEKSIQLLTLCVTSDATSPEALRRGYIARAWAYHNVGRMPEAVADQEAAFTIAPANYGELINYALYLRLAGRALDSLEPLRKAERIENAKGYTSMMTQYHLGWSLQELGRHEEAVAAFSKGIPRQTDFAYAYFRRGLSLEVLGRKDDAKRDFEKVATLIATPSKGNTLDDELSPILKKLDEYGIK
jgi:tetratricopeptide (TPR) repeat protein